MCGPQFCSMKLSQEVREIEAAKAGLEQKAREFAEAGGELYVDGRDHAAE
jgi:phosphomethylpyrimidine synthase